MYHPLMKSESQAADSFQDVEEGQIL